MKKLVILIFSMVMAGEMEVDGNLTVTDTLIVNNKDVNATIDSLLSLIAQLEIRIAQLECQNTGIIPDGYCDCFFHTLDECGVCNGDTTSCQDCAGVLNGDNLQDMCGYCDNDSSNDCIQDCSGEWGGVAEYDVCGICGGDAISEDECYVTDIDGYIYEAVGIGDQIWMAENLKVTHYNNGDDILTGYTDGEWHQLQAGAYAVYDDDPSNSDTYGKLYNWHAVDDDRGVCPEGWHVPSYEEWTILTDYLGGTSVAGGKMKEAGFDHWNSPNTGATNESGFTGLAAGYRNGSSGHYSAMLIHGYFWSFFENSGNSTYSYLSFNDSYLTWDDNNNEHGFSIRCVLGD